MYLGLFLLIWLVDVSEAVNRCGISFANSGCGTLCPGGTDAECNRNIGERCYSSAPACLNGIGTPCNPSSATYPQGGTCLNVGDCNSNTGALFSGLCPGPSTVKCCVPYVGTVCQASAGAGVCGESSQCSGTSFSGLCPGPSNIKCCVRTPASSPTVPPTSTTTPPSTSSSTCLVGRTVGSRKNPANCRGFSFPITGQPSTSQCCVLEPVSTTPLFLPVAPSSSGSQGACVSPQNGFHGQCLSLAACTGANFNNLCPGSSVCCAAETRSIYDISALSPLALSATTFNTLFTGISAGRATAMRPYFNYALAKVVVDASSAVKQCYRAAAFIAQVGHESAGLRYFEEIASGAAYEGRTDLGNVFPGDGVRYKGRGPIQLTGRSNYKTTGTRIATDLETNPEMVCFPSIGFLTTTDYWISRNLNIWSESSSEANFEELTRRINGGSNGIADRRARWYQARTLLGCDSL